MKSPSEKPGRWDKGLYSHALLCPPGMTMPLSLGPPLLSQYKAGTQSWPMAPATPSLHGLTAPLRRESIYFLGGEALFLPLYQYSTFYFFPKKVKGRLNQVFPYSTKKGKDLPFKIRRCLRKNLITEETPVPFRSLLKSAVWWPGRRPARAPLDTSSKVFTL